MLSLPPELIIGVPSIDRDHQGLVLRLDRLIHDREVAPSTAIFSELLSEFGGLLDAHFRSEEAFLRSCGMPRHDIDAHVDAHDAILDQYFQMNDDLMRGKMRRLREVTAKLRNWVVSHQMRHDIRIRSFV